MFPAPFHDTAHSSDGSSPASKLGMAEVKQGPQEFDAKMARATFGKVFDEDIQSSAMIPHLAAQRQALRDIGSEAEDQNVNTLGAVSDASEPMEQNVEVFGAPAARQNPVLIAVDARIEAGGHGIVHLVTGAAPKAASQSPRIFTEMEASGELEGDLTAGWPHAFPDRPVIAPTVFGQPLLTDPAGEAAARYEGRIPAQDTNRQRLQGPVDSTTLTATGYRETVGEPDEPRHSAPASEPILEGSVWRRARPQIPHETVGSHAVKTDSVAPIKGLPGRLKDTLVPPRANDHSPPTVSSGRPEPLLASEATPAERMVPQDARFSPGKPDQDLETASGSAPMAFRRSNEWRVEGRPQSSHDATGTGGNGGIGQEALTATQANTTPNLGPTGASVASGRPSLKGPASIAEEPGLVSTATVPMFSTTRLPALPRPSEKSVAMNVMSFNSIASPPPQMSLSARESDPEIALASGQTTFIPKGATEAKTRIAYAIDFPGPGMGKRETAKESLDGLLVRDSGTMLESSPYRSEIRPAAPQTSTALSASHTHAQAVVAQVATAAETTRTGRAEVKLDPEELGKVTLNLITSDRAITVLIATERVETLDLMRRNIEMLGQEFRQMGYQDVSFAFREQGGQSREWDGGPDAIDDARDEHSLDDSPTASLQVSDGHLDIRL